MQLYLDDVSKTIGYVMFKQASRPNEICSSLAFGFYMLYYAISLYGNDANNPFGYTCMVQS